METEEIPAPREVGSITPEQVGGVLKAASDYLRSQGLFVNMAIAIVEANGYYTVGNMPDEMMERVFSLYLARNSLPGTSDVKTVDPDTGQVYATH